MAHEEYQFYRKQEDLLTALIYISIIWLIIELNTWGLSNVREGGNIWGNLFLPVAGTMILLLLIVDHHFERRWKQTQKINSLKLPSFFVWGLVVFMIVLSGLRLSQIFLNK